MSLFGLGSFAEGFIGGFAESANKALIEDMNDIKDRVKTVSDYRVKRAVEENEKRTEEFNEIKDALKEGASLFGDDPRAAEYAASLLKDQGNLATYKKFIAEMREKKNTSGIDPAGFFARAATDAPAAKGYTVSDYARAYQGAPKTLPDYRLPEDTVSAGAGNLLSAIGFTPDVSGQIQERTTEQMAAMGVGVDDTERVALPSIVFRSEDYNLADKTAAERLKYFDDKGLNPNLSPEKREEYRVKAVEQAKLAAASADETVKLEGLQRLLRSATGDEAADITSSIIDVKKQIERKEAAVSTDPAATLKLDKKDKLIKAADPETTEEDRNKILTEVSAIDDRISELTKGLPSEAERLSKAVETHQRMMRTNPDYKAGNPEFDEAQAQIDEMREIEKSVGPIDVTPTDVRAAETVIESAVDRAVLNSEMTEDLSPEFLKIYRIIAAEKNKDVRRRQINDLSPTERKVYDEGMAIVNSRSAGVIENTVRVLSQTNRKGAAAAKLAAQLFPGYTAPTVDEPAATTPAAADDAAVSAGDVAEIPNTEAGALAAIKQQKNSAAGYTLDEMKSDLKQAVESGASPEFIKAINDEIKITEAAQGTDENMVRVAMEPGIDYDAAAKESTAAAEQDVEAASRIIDDVTGFASKEIRAIQKELGISREAATRLHAQAMAAKELSRTNTRSKRRGMMARSTTKAQG